MSPECGKKLPKLYKDSKELLQSMAEVQMLGSNSCKTKLLPRMKISTKYSGNATKSGHDVFIFKP